MYKIDLLVGEKVEIVNKYYDINNLHNDEIIVIFSNLGRDGVNYTIDK